MPRSKATTAGKKRERGVAPHKKEPISCADLRSLWERNSKKYAEREIGSGTKAFVREVLTARELFGLTAGEPATLDDHRSHEYIEERSTKASRSADFVVYMPGGIVVPIEVEKFGGIETGIEQIEQYQKDLRIKVGILTDGFEWRFYNNHGFITLSLDEILDEPDVLREYWRNYTQPLNYYLNFFEPLRGAFRCGAMGLALYRTGEAWIRRDFFDDVTTLIRSLNATLPYKGRDEIDQRRRTEMTYAYVIQFLLYKTLVDNDVEDYGSRHRARLASVYTGLKSGIL